GRLVKAGNLIGSVTALRLYKLNPAICAAVEKCEDIQRRLAATLVQPGQQSLKVTIHCQRLGLVDKPKAGLKAGDHDRPPASMRVPCTPGHLCQQPGVLIRAKATPDR